MASGIVGDVVICVHNSLPPSDTEWSEFVAHLRSGKEITKMKNLVFTTGGAPNSGQRRQVNELLNGRPGLAAVVSASTVVRGVVTAFNWFNPEIKAFGVGSESEAFRHLRVDPREVEAILKETARLRTLVGDPKAGVTS